MVSLIVATVNRVEEFERLLGSLSRQSERDFEVIVVDQNADDRLLPALQRHPELRIQHLRSLLGVSRARNAGLRSARGNIVCFPDDDCWYPDNLLATVTAWFAAHPEFDALFTGMRSADHRLMASRWAPRACPCSENNVWHCASAITAFLRMRAAGAVGYFNESFGPGTSSSYQSGEDMDYFVRLTKLGLPAWYDPAITVHHPELHAVERFRRTSYKYALGVGYVLRVHDYSWWYLGQFLLRSLGGALISLCKADLARAGAYLLRAAGLLLGYVFGPRDLRKQPESSATHDIA